MRTITPTPRQLLILQAISNFRARHSYSPTIGELATQMNISRSTAFEHIGELREKNLLSASPLKARSLEITPKARKLLKSLEPDDLDENMQGTIPLAGRIAAGQPIEAVENIDHISLENCFKGGESNFALEVTGDSMIDDGICPGDYVICKPAQTARSGQMVVAIVDDDNATLKRFYKEKNRIRLQPANSSYKPIYTKNCRIQATVVGLLRKF